MTKRNKILPEQRHNGSWRVRWSQHGKRKIRSFQSKAEASSFCRKLNSGETLSSEKADEKRNVKSKSLVIHTFSDLANKFMKNHVYVKTKHSTQRNYEMQLRNQILPVLGSIPVEELHLRDLDDLAAELSTMQKQKGELNRRTVSNHSRSELSKPKTLSPKMQRDCICLVLTIMNYCYQREYVDKNPFRRFKLPKVVSTTVPYLTGEEVEKFLGWCDEGGPYTTKNSHGEKEVRLTLNIERDSELFRFALHTGCRLGEILGLKRKSLDFDNRLIWVSEIYDQSAKALATRTKGGNVRCVEMDDLVFKILSKRKAFKPEQLIFPSVGNPIWKDKFYIYCNRAGIKKISFHAFRHTFASTMALYTPPAVLQKILGHASWSTTMKYVHIAKSNVVGYTKYLEGMYKKHRDIENLASLTLAQKE